MEREVRYCTTEDGVRIAYRVQGEGPTLVMCQHYIESFSVERLLPELGRFISRLRPGRRIVQYDSRGTGLSTRDADDMSAYGRLLDLEAVVAAVDEQPVSLFAAGMSGPLGLRFALDHPDRLNGLLLIGVYAWRTEAFTPDVRHPDFRHAMARLARTNWPLAAQTLGDLSTRRANPEGSLRLGEAYRLSSSGEAVSQRFMAFHSPGKDIRNDLAKITTPTLIVHRRDDVNFPFEVGQQLASAIPNAVFAPVEGMLSYYPFGDQESILQPILSFLSDEGRAEADGKPGTLPFDPKDALPAVDEFIGPAGRERRQYPEGLTAREVEVLRLIAAGRTNREIAAELVLSPRTVGRHITNLYGKIGARGKADAATYAMRHKLT